jgi:ACT domain-containing protein
MEIKKAIGRPSKVTQKTIIILEDAIQHNSTIGEACRSAGISRDTYYRYMNNKMFAEKMKKAKENQNKVVFSFLTIY